MFYNFKCSVCKNDIQAEYQYIGELVACPICDSVQIVPDPPLLVDSIFSGYRISEIYASSHLWTSYKAIGETEHPGQEVLLRIPSSFYLKNDMNPELFFNMVLRTGSLNIEGFPALVDRSITPGRTYFIYEFSHKAKTLSGFASKQVPISSADSIKIIRNIACALNKAWEKENLIHQNLKPSNVRVDEDGNVMIYEFAVSPSLIGNSELLNKGFNIWDYRYMSPEFIRNGVASDQRCDIYSLGGIFYLLLTGHHPYAEKNPEEVPDSPLPDPREFNYEVPANYISIIEKLMAKDINERFQSWNEVIEYINITCPESLAPPEASGTDLQRINIAAISTGRFEPAGQLAGRYNEPARKSPKRTGKIKKTNFTDTIARINPEIIPGINKQWKTGVDHPDSDAQAVKVFFWSAAVIGFTCILVIIMLYSHYSSKNTPAHKTLEEVQSETPTVIAPAPEPEKKLPTATTQKQPQPPKVASSQKRMSFKEICDFYDSNPAINLSEAYRRFDTLKAEAIRVEDVKLVQDINEKQHAIDLFKKEKVSAVIEKLKNDTAQLVKDGNLHDACEKIENYTGEFADESVSERRLLSASLKKSVSDEKSTSIKADMDACMAKGDFEGAEKLAAAFKGKTEEETLKLRQLMQNYIDDRKTKFTREISPLYGEVCDNVLAGQPDAGIDKIKAFIAAPPSSLEATAYANNLLANMNAYKSISQSQILLDEKLKQCDTVKGDTSFLRTMLCLQDKSYDKAKENIRKIKYHLGDGLMDVVLEHEAEAVFAVMLSKYDLSFNSGKTEQFLLELTQKKIQPANAVALAGALNQFTEKYKTTSFANKYENIIEAVRKFCRRAGAEETVKSGTSVTVTPDDPQGGIDLLHKSLMDRTSAMSIFLKQGSYHSNKLRELNVGQNGTKLTGEPGTVIRNNLSVTGKDIVISGINFEGSVTCSDNAKSVIFRNCMFKSDLTKVLNSSSMTFQNCLFKGLLLDNASVTMNHCTILASPNAPDKAAALWLKGDTEIEINNSIIYGDGYGIAFTNPDNSKNRKINNSILFGEEGLCVVISQNKIDEKEKVETDKKTKLSKYFKLKNGIHSPPQFVDDKKGIWRLVKGVPGTRKADDGKDCGMVFEE